jgi:hypothetical protein
MSDIYSKIMFPKYLNSITFSMILPSCSIQTLFSFAVTKDLRLAKSGGWLQAWTWKWNFWQYWSVADYNTDRNEPRVFIV